MITRCDINGVRYRRLDSGRCLLQVRMEFEGLRKWVDVRDAVAYGISPTCCAQFKKQYSESEAKIARVELMEMLGLDVAAGVLWAYANAKHEIQINPDGRRRHKEGKIVQAEQLQPKRVTKCRKRRVVSDDELRKYKPGIFGVFCPDPVNKQARDAVMISRNGVGQ